MFTQNSGSAGGVIYASSTTSTNCSFVDNSTSSGGAIYAYGIAKLFNNILWHTVTETQATLIYISSTGSLRNSDSEFPSPLNQSKNLIKGGMAAITAEAGAAVSLGNTTETILTSDPVFVDASNPIGPDGIWGTADDGLRLLGTSPAKDLGLSMFLPADTYDLDQDGDLAELMPVDLAGYNRIQGASLDLGAYEVGDAIGDGVTFASWASDNGLTGDDALETANPSGDGINNLIKYALGLDPNLQTLAPTDGVNEGLPKMEISGAGMTFTFIKDTAKSDLTYTVESCTTLNDWSTVTTGLAETLLSGTMVRVVATLPLSDQRFCRLHVMKQTD